MFIVSLFLSRLFFFFLLTARQERTNMITNTDDRHAQYAQRRVDTAREGSTDNERKTT